MSGYLLVFLGAGFGGALRHGVNLASVQAGLAFAWATLAVNVAGSFAMGLLAGWLALKAGEGWTREVRLFLATGILGGFTTFSAFSLDAVLLWGRAEKTAALAYIGGSVVLSIGALLLGLFVVRVLT